MAIICIPILYRNHVNSVDAYKILKDKRFVFVQNQYDLMQNGHQGAGFDLQAENLFVSYSTVIKNNKLYGFREVRDDNGNVILRGSYLNNKKIGIWHEYENNKVKIKVAFDENEKFSGIYREFFPNGDIKEEKYYFQGKEIKSSKNKKENIKKI